jgi:hypothetical protein
MFKRFGAGLRQNPPCQGISKVAVRECCAGLSRVSDAAVVSRVGAAKADPDEEKGWISMGK